MAKGFPDPAINEQSLTPAEVAEICTEFLNGGQTRFRKAVAHGTKFDVLHLTMGLMAINGYKAEQAMRQVQLCLRQTHDDNSEDMSVSDIREAQE